MKVNSSAIVNDVHWTTLPHRKIKIHSFRKKYICIYRCVCIYKKFTYESSKTVEFFFFCSRHMFLVLWQAKYTKWRSVLIVVISVGTNIVLIVYIYFIYIFMWRQWKNLPSKRLYNAMYIDIPCEPQTKSPPRDRGIFTINFDLYTYAPSYLI